MRKVLWEPSRDEFDTMSVADLIAKLTDLAGGFPHEEVFFEIYQSGDQWDGYSEVEIRVEREETDTEKAERKAQQQKDIAEWEAKKEAEQRAQFERLKAKFG